jgi:hypothetical protein
MLHRVALPQAAKRQRSAFIGFDAGWMPKWVDPPRRPRETEHRDRVAYQLTQLVC